MNTVVSYPSALYWNTAFYQPSADKPIDKSSIQVEIGEIIKQVNSIPKSNGEINVLPIWGLKKDL